MGEFSIVSETPQNQIGDNAYDSDNLRTELQQRRIELIAPAVAIEEIEQKTYAGCDGTVDVGRLSRCLPG
jgi:hypothetical protein